MGQAFQACHARPSALVRALPALLWAEAARAFWLRKGRWVPAQIALG